MKFKLKNRPKAKLPIIGKPDKDYDRIEVTEWFEGFEKELTERLSKITFQMSVTERLKAYAQLLAEILGEIKE